ncbi:CDP-alcohol phosphatidyltransferase family protein [Demequina sp. TTPB684]|uniref:CDP-alcohol phosphatidyltransferase family protein n=1 Tax=unclassified Demequina TaxID=2620311 RepID=UPI001CF518F2|nr:MULTISPECIES: CDP-alcohol phosphatidyltransferase family protein [unclassified Demequina]MCB2413806.1 CDP-alcohol phosphatidyltransferase family protein [Demequina sp. TTPB684]UPU89286.1 CDP-alcohol phosphatidyltransferase family protein [Demequina sp. TMPB413]
MLAADSPASWWRLNATVPNAITVLRIVLIGVFVVLLVRHQDGWAITALAVAGVSDFVDGYLARRWGQTSELGRILDPAADRLLTVAVVLGLAWRDIIPWWLVAVLLARDAVMAIALLWLARLHRPTPVVTFLGKSATAALYVFLPLSYLAFDRWDGVHALAVWGAAGAAVAYWGSAVQYLAQVRRTGSIPATTP